MKRRKKKLYRQFQMELSQTAREEIDRMIKDHIMVTDIWDNKHFCNAYWTSHYTYNLGRSNDRYPETREVGLLGQSPLLQAHIRGLGRRTQTRM